MANTTFYRNVSESPSKITWKDIFSEFNKNHTKQDMEYAFLAGTSLDMADESTMLQKWRKPWLFWRLLLIGAAFIVICLITIFLFSNQPYTLLIVIGPMVGPVVLMIFFWELNIPRNISIFALMLFFVAGAFLSFLCLEVLFQIPMINFANDAKNTAIGAPLREEPAKLIATVLLLIFVSKKKGFRVYGLTGLVIGAAVGTGFSAFESFEYGINNGIPTLVARFLFSVVGHTLYAAPYGAAIALHMKNNKLSVNSFANKDFVITFCMAFCMHMFNNAGYYHHLPLFIVFLIELICLWSVALYIIRKCLQQVVMIGQGASFQGLDISQYAMARPRVVSLSDGRPGQEWAVTGQGTKLGRNPSCQIIPYNPKGISREHCLIQYDPANRVFYVYDLHSSYGTFLANGARISPNQPAVLQPGQEFVLPNQARFRVEA